MFSFFMKKDEKPELVNTIQASDDDIVAVADGTMIPLEEVKDDVFSQKRMGDGVAFEMNNDVVVSPCNGLLEAVFPTGHAYGITMASGVVLMIHIGVNTVEGKGDGFQILVKQGDTVKAGDPLVKLDMKKLKAKYDMTVMLIVTDTNGQEVNFADYGEVTRGQKINR